MNKLDLCSWKVIGLNPTLVRLAKSLLGPSVRCLTPKKPDEWLTPVRRPQVSLSFLHVSKERKMRHLKNNRLHSTCLCKNGK